MTTTNSTPAEVSRQLDALRQEAAKAVADDIQALLPVLRAALADPSNGPQDLPEGTPEWMRSAVSFASHPGGAICWGSARALLAAQTAKLMAESQTSSGFSGGALAHALGIDLFDFATECWAAMGPEMAPAMTAAPESTSVAGEAA